MTVRRTAAAAAVLGATPLILAGPAAGPASAHGSMQNPISRVSACYAEGPENPRSAACKAAIEASGKQAFYDWNEVNIANAAGAHKSLIPDGKLCSAGRDKYRGLDLPRDDWPATNVSSGPFTFAYKATAAHKGRFDLYITKDGYDPSQPLKWSDLESEPFVSAVDPQLVNGSFVFDGQLPGKSGRHLIYAIWQRSDSPEAFYSCSDVVFDGGSGSGTAGGSTGGDKIGGAGGGTGGGAGTTPQPDPTGSQAAGGSSSDPCQHDHGDTGASSATYAPAPGEVLTPYSAKNAARTTGDSGTPILVLGAAAAAFGLGALLGRYRLGASRR